MMLSLSIYQVPIVPLGRPVVYVHTRWNLNWQLLDYISYAVQMLLFRIHT